MGSKLQSMEMKSEDDLGAIEAKMRHQVKMIHNAYD